MIQEFLLYAVQQNRLPAERRAALPQFLLSRSQQRGVNLDNTFQFETFLGWCQAELDQANYQLAVLGALPAVSLPAVGVPSSAMASPPSLAVTSAETPGLALVAGTSVPPAPSGYLRRASKQRVGRRGEARIS